MTFATQVADLLSVLTIISCSFMKVPQIQQVRKTMNADGLYWQAMLTEIAGFSTMSLYNYTNGYSIITYMEYPLILVQAYVLLYYTLLYKNKLYSPLVTFTAVVYVITVAGFAAGIFPKFILACMVPLCTPLSGFAKVMYIYGIIVDCNADAISLTTWAISIGTNLARVFTVYMDSEDVQLMINFMISAFLSTAVLVTAMIYKCTPDAPRPRSPPDLPRSRRKSTHYD